MENWEVLKTFTEEEIKDKDYDRFYLPHEERCELLYNLEETYGRKRAAI